MTDALLVWFECAGATDEDLVDRLARRATAPAVMLKDDEMRRGIQAGRP